MPLLRERGRRQGEHQHDDDGFHTHVALLSTERAARICSISLAAPACSITALRRLRRVRRYTVRS
jgi:hypothetical protein